MKINLIVGAEAAYACITHDHGTLDVRVELGENPYQSLVKESLELRRQAAEKIIRAQIIERAARHLIAQTKKKRSRKA